MKIAKLSPLLQREWEKLKLGDCPLPIEVSDWEVEFQKGHLEEPGQHPDLDDAARDARALARCIAHEMTRRRTREHPLAADAAGAANQAADETGEGARSHTSDETPSEAFDRLLREARHMKIILAILAGLLLLLCAERAHGDSKIYTITVTDGTHSTTSAAPFSLTFSGCTTGGTPAAPTITCNTGTNNPGGSGNQIQYNSGGAFGGIGSGNPGQVMESNGSGSPPSFQDPIISYNYANLLSAATATGTASSASLARISTFGGYGTLYVTFASIAGSYSGCTIQLKNGDSLGNLINNGSAISIGPVANGTQSFSVTSGAGLYTTAQMSATWACAGYGSGGTITADYAPGIAVGVMNFPATQAVSWSGQSVTATQGTGANLHVQVDTAPTTAVTAASLPLPTGAATSANQSAGTAGTPSSVVESMQGVSGMTPLDTNLKQVAGSSVATAASGVQKVGIAGNSGATLDQAPGSASPANALQICGTDATNCVVPYIDPCQRGAKTYFSISQTSNAKLISGTSSKKVYLCDFHVVTAGANNVALVEGTGSVCATNTVQVSGFPGTGTAATGWNFAANGGLAIGNGQGALGVESVAADDVCLYNSASTQISGGGSYVVF